MKRVAIVQSNYIPWRGYFDLISSVDEFILLDDVQYTKQDWRNRNRIKTENGVVWLTIPVQGGLHKRIDQVEVANPGWASRHLATLTQAYRSAPGLERCLPWLTELYQEANSSLLSEVNRAFLERICAELGVTTPLVPSRLYGASGTKSRSLLELCLAAGADEYLSGPAARSYLDEGLFERAGMRSAGSSTRSTRRYPQLYPPFEPRLSILDLLVAWAPSRPTTCGLRPSRWRRPPIERNRDIRDRRPGALGPGPVRAGTSTPRSPSRFTLSTSRRARWTGCRLSPSRASGVPSARPLLGLRRLGLPGDERIAGRCLRRGPRARLRAAERDRPTASVYGDPRRQRLRSPGVVMPYATVGAGTILCARPPSRTMPPSATTATSRPTAVMGAPGRRPLLYRRRRDDQERGQRRRALGDRRRGADHEGHRPRQRLLGARHATPRHPQLRAGRPIAPAQGREPTAAPSPRPPRADTSSLPRSTSTMGPGVRVDTSKIRAAEIMAGAPERRATGPARTPRVRCRASAGRRASS